MKILVLHGLGSGKNNGTAKAIASIDNVEVYAPEIPFDPIIAFEAVKEFNNEYNPDIIVGTSLGGFYTISIDTKAYKLLINPAMDIANDIKNGILKDNEELVCNFTKIRSNGEAAYRINNDYINKLTIIKNKYDNQVFKYNDKDKIQALFGIDDELFHHADDYKLKYNNNYKMIPTHHHLTTDELNMYVVKEVLDIIKKEF